MRSLLLAGLAVAAFPNSAGAQDTVWTRPATALGCYSLAVGDWVPSLSLAGDTVFVTPPAEFELTADTADVRSPSVPLWHVRAAASDWLPLAYWHPIRGDTLRVVFSNGHSGVALVLPSVGEIRRGRAVTFWDFPRERQVASIEVRHRACR